MVTFFLVMTYVLKARGLTSARELGGGVFSRTVMLRAADVAASTPRPGRPSRRGPSRPCPPRARVTGGSLWRLRGLAGPVAGRTFDLDGEAVLGRDAKRCHVHLEEPTVSREHATLLPDPARAGWAVQRLSRTGPCW